ncbi:MAG: serine/threonine-protein kinase [Planctomycetaceae bacterium]
MSSSDRVAQILETHHLDWMRGKRLFAEEIFRLHADMKWTPEDQLDVIYSEVLLREQAEETVTLQSLVERFPHLAEELKVQWEVHASLRPAAETRPAAVSETYPSNQSTDAVLPPSPPGFQLLSLLGRGGAGRVYLAKDLTLDRLAAIKILDVHTKNVTQRLEREATTLAKISHPQIVQIYSVGTMQQQCWMAMEYVPGGSLRSVLRGRPLDARTAASLLVKVCRAVGAAHEIQIIHCDLNPANILIREVATDDSSTRWLESADVRVTDFGLARLLSADLTVSSGIEGTFLYMSPEQAAGQRAELTPSTDVYGLGATLYELLTGRPPFAGSSPLELIEQIRNQIPVSPSELRPEISQDIETICLKCLEKEPARRYRDASELADDLQRFLDGYPVLARPVSIAGSVARWAKRNRSLATAMLSAAVILVTGIVATSVAALMAMSYADDATNAAITANQESRKARDEAEKAREAQQKADAEAKESSLLADNLVRIIQAADPRLNQRVISTTELTIRILGDKELMAGLSHQRQFRLKLALARTLQGLAKDSVAVSLFEELMKDSQLFLDAGDERRLHIQRDLAVLVAPSDPERAVSLMQDLVTNTAFSASQRSHVSFKLTEMLFNSGDLNAAEKQLETMRQLQAQDPADSIGPFRGRMLECRMMYSSGRAEKALPICRALCSNTPDGMFPLVAVEPTLQLGECLEVLGQLEEAADRFEEAATRAESIAGSSHPLTLECLLKMTEVDVRLGRHKKVIEVLGPLVATQSEAASASTNGLLARLLLLHSRWAVDPMDGTLSEGVEVAQQLLERLSSGWRTGLVAILAFEKAVATRAPEHVANIDALLKDAADSNRFNSELTGLIRSALQKQ